MANLNNILNERIRRLSRRQIAGDIKTIRKAMAQYRRDIAALKRQVRKLEKETDRVAREGRSRSIQDSAPQKGAGIRFRADGLRSHRAKLGLSAREYGQLVNVSGLTIYNWENGKTRPRAQQLAKLAAVRGMGKRKVAEWLQSLKRDEQK